MSESPPGDAVDGASTDGDLPAHPPDELVHFRSFVGSRRALMYPLRMSFRLLARRFCLRLD